MLNKAKKKLNNKLVKIVIVTIAILICFFGIIPLFINFLVNTTNPFEIGFINEQNKETWINFFGAIIGGGLTLIGVWWTIKEQNKNLIKQQEQLDRQRREDLIIQYKPILVFSGNKIEDVNSEILYIDILFENKGRGEAIDINLKYFQIDQRNEYTLYPFKVSEDILTPNCKFIFSSFLLRKNNPKINNNILTQKKIFPIEKDKEFNFTASLSYKNPIDQNIEYFNEFDFKIFQAISKKDQYKIKTLNECPNDLEKEWVITVNNMRYRYTTKIKK